MTTTDNTTFTTTKEQYLGNVQHDIARWRRGYDQISSEAVPVATQDRAELSRVWLELENAYRDLQTADETSWETMQRRTERSAQAFRDTWVIIVKRIEVADDNEIGWLRGFTDDLSTQSSNGWLEGMSSETGDSEGWTEGYDKSSD